MTFIMLIAASQLMSKVPLPSAQAPEVRDGATVSAAEDEDDPPFWGRCAR